jgi:RimJ/RimL family protein N-acetyltransferase
MTHIERLVIPRETLRGTEFGLAGLLRRLAHTVPGVHRPRALRGPRMASPVDAHRIDTERLTLRPHRLDDAEQWFSLQSDPRTVQFISWELRNRDESYKHLRDRTRKTRLWQADDFMALAVEHDGTLIGDVSLHLRSVDPEQRKAEVGWVLHPEHGGHGYATEAAAAMVRFALDELAATTVTAVIDRRNERSVALARRLGFTHFSSTPTHLTLAIHRN